VLVAKLNAVLRRVYDRSDKVPALECHGAVLNLNDGTLTYADEQLELTRNEFRIVQTLMENRGKIVSRDKLMTRLWQNDCYVEENTLTVNVTRLRKKLEQAGLKGFIATKVGSGYIIP
jgi:DNA-binding response OmpR family regulator